MFPALPNPHQVVVVARRPSWIVAHNIPSQSKCEFAIKKILALIYHLFKPSQEKVFVMCRQHYRDYYDTESRAGHLRYFFQVFF